MNVDSDQGQQPAVCMQYEDHNVSSKLRARCTRRTMLASLALVRLAGDSGCTWLI